MNKKQSLDGKRELMLSFFVIFLATLIIPIVLLLKFESKVNTIYVLTYLIGQILSTVFFLIFFIRQRRARSNLENLYLKVNANLSRINIYYEHVNNYFTNTKFKNEFGYTVVVPQEGAGFLPLNKDLQTFRIMLTFALFNILGVMISICFLIHDKWRYFYVSSNGMDKANLMALANQNINIEEIHCLFKSFVGESCYQRLDFSNEVKILTKEQIERAEKKLKDIHFFTKKYDF
jgi:hypothetical protein